MGSPGGRAAPGRFEPLGRRTPVPSPRRGRRPHGLPKAPGRHAGLREAAHTGRVAARERAPDARPHDVRRLAGAPGRARRQPCRSAPARAQRSSMSLCYHRDAMAMPRSTERFLTTHTGSLPRPSDLIRMMFAKEEGVPVEPAAFGARIRAAVVEVVRKQVEAGVAIVNDGEMSKPSYATYVKDRLN